MADELIERLRSSAKAYRCMLHGSHADDCEAAADFIEQHARIEPVSEAAIAEVVHDAMVWAAKQGGQPRRWQNGNSIAESHARQAAAAIQSVHEGAVTEGQTPDLNSPSGASHD